MNFPSLLKTSSLGVGSLFLLSQFPESARAEFRQQARFFGTLGAGSIDTPYPYLEIDNGANVQDLSRFGLNYSITDGRDLSLFAELVAQPKTVEATWYFVNWRPSSSFMARAGRMRFASWIFSETRAVGFNYPWPTLPMDVYQFNPFDGITGVSSEYTVPLPIGSLAFEGQIGSVDGTFASSRFQSEVAYVGSVTYSLEDLTLYTSGLTTTSRVEGRGVKINSLESRYLTAGIKAQFGPLVLLSEGVMIKAEMSKAEKKQSKRDAEIAGAELQKNPIRAQDPAVQKVLAKGFLAGGKFVDSRAAYLHIGYEIDQVQPYLLAAIVKAEKNVRGASNQKRYGAGVVWYATEQVALKFQGSYLDVDNKNTGLLSLPTEVLQGAQPKKIEPKTLVLGSIDFLF